LDANIFIAASASTGGGSSLLLELCVQGKATAVATRLILRESERNIRSKLNDEALARFYTLLARLNPTLIPLPAQSDIDEAAKMVNKKDALVLAAARSSRAEYLITLDRKHLLTDGVRQSILPIISCTPGEFLKEFLSK
jgi:putative PIN family toxin of toxin-antitoxin system